MDKPIPAFYCCYLLRSTVCLTRLYVGSTPHPPRRLKQHNGGQSRGGAARTDRDDLRPWEMTCIVTGFPSKIAALQFEWAWQNTHVTRHIPTEDRITAGRKRGRKRNTRPSTFSLTDRLSNLHLLLRVKSFGRWPLCVTFFAEDVYLEWKICEKKTPFKLRSGISVELEKADPPQACRRPGAEHAVDNSKAISNGKGIEGIDVSYDSLKAYVEKSKALLKEDRRLACAVCAKQMQPQQCITLVCPHEDCRSISHMTCLSDNFLKQEKRPDAIVPLQGQCPGCKRLTQWSTVVKELSLRIRGEKEVESLFKPRRRRAASPSKANAAIVAAVAVVGAMQGDASSDDESECPDIDNVAPDATGVGHKSLYDSDEFEDIDEWFERKDADETDTDTDIDMEEAEEEEEELRGTVSRASVAHKASPIVIEDSDWDDDELD